MLEQSQPLGGERRRNIRYAGDVTARPRQPIDQAGGDRIAGAEGDDRGDTRRLGSERQRIAYEHDRVDVARLHVPENFRQLAHFAHNAASIQHQVLPERVATLRQHAHDDRAERALIANRVPGTERAQAIDLG